MNNNEINLEDVSILNEHQKKIIGVASVAHNAVSTFDQTMGGVFTPWESTSAFYQTIMAELITFTISKNPQVNELHAYWVSQMMANGWEYGLEINIDNKTHTNIKTFEQLDFEEQIKYGIIISIVMALSPALIRSMSSELN